MTITVLAEDDHGVLIITSSQPGSQLTVANCTGIGSNQIAGQRYGSGMAAVSNQGTKTILIGTTVLDEDAEREDMIVTLTLIVTGEEETAATVAADQPGNVGPDNVTIHCRPETSTPTPSPTATPTMTPSPTGTPPPTVTVAAPSGDFDDDAADLDDDHAAEHRQRGHPPAAGTSRGDALMAGDDRE